MTAARTGAVVGLLAIPALVIGGLVGATAAPTLTTRVSALESQVAKLNAAVFPATPPPSATPTPTAVPTPALPPAPSAVGITYTDFRIPCSIDDNGTADVYQSLGAWVSTIPDGADATHRTRILPCKATSVYRIVSENPEPALQGGFQMKGRAHITIDGLGRWSSFPTFAPSAAGAAAYAAFNPYTAWVKGAQVIHRSPGLGGFSALFFTEDSDDIRVTGWTVDGGDTAVATVHIEPWENRSLFYVRFGSSNIEFDGNFADSGGGFGLIVAADSGHTANPPRNVRSHDNFVRGYETHPGIVSCIGCEAYHEIVKDSTGSAFDIEPERAGDIATDVSIHDSVYDTFSWGATRSCWLASIVPAVPTVTMDRYTITRLLVPRGPATAQNGNYPGQGGFSVRADSANVKNDISITDIYSLDDQAMAAGGGRASVKVANVNNLRVTGNRQVLSGTAPLIYQPAAGLTGTVVLSPNP